MATDYGTERAKYSQHNGNKYDGNGGKNSIELLNTPLFSLHSKYIWNAKTFGTLADDYKEIPFSHTSTANPFTQSALLGFHAGTHDHIMEDEPIMLNTSAPNSTFICGSQGSGKSYTLSCMLENCLLADPNYGSVANPVAGVAFHYDAEGGDSLAEVASLCSRGVKVRVLLSASNVRNLKPKYMALPGADEHLTVDTLAFRQKDLNIGTIYKLMAFSESENGPPLYEQVVGQVLRQMAIDGEKFTMRGFENKSDLDNLDVKQKKMLNLRVTLLKSYLAEYITGDLKPKTESFQTTPGTLTIVDLTDPFVSPATVCMLFDIALGFFKQQGPADGMIIALDEAHRYMNESAAAAMFTESLLTTIRLQRHTGTRVVIATQEPTISEKLLDLCSTSIIHRFSSPSWFGAIKEHLAGASSLLASDEERKQMFGSIVDLCVGESLVFSPSSFVCVNEGVEKRLGMGCMKMKTRSRKGVDSGKTKFAGDAAVVDTGIIVAPTGTEAVPVNGVESVNGLGKSDLPLRQK